MIIGGLQKTTLIDYPGKIACTVFLAVCNFRCPWCYSGELVLPVKIINQPRIKEQDFFKFLRERKGLIDGVVICGGEPTINKDLPSFIKKIKNMPASPSQGGGFLVKLDTNGSNPKMLKDLIDENLIDYVAMDIKGPMGPNFQFSTRLASRAKRVFNFQSILGETMKIEDIQKSVEILKKGNVDFEFRTTVVPGIHEKQDFFEIAKWIGGPDVKYYLQNFRPEKTIDPEFEKVRPFQKEFMEEIIKDISPFFKNCQLR
ncbi:MAG: anaerobic ribonucleoside-triphosphate reductase activating protein [Patescibacteria group bacterium]